LSSSSKSLHNQFYSLSSDEVLNSVEKALGRTQHGQRATGSLLALNSLENRVYQMEFEDKFRVVTKFYRPGRWNRAQLEEEHDFLFRLQAAEVPAVAALKLKGFQNGTVGETADGIFFTVFPSVGGRLLDELNTTHLEVLGRHLGRIHSVGSQFRNTTRKKIDVNTFGRIPLKRLIDMECFETPALQTQYQNICEQVFQKAEPQLSWCKYLRVHGDCHLGNTLWNGEQAFFLDFDDLCLAPAVQDVWMIIRGRDEEAVSQRETILKAYQQMFDFDPAELDVIESLRALRIIHYSGWIAERWEDPSFQRAFPDFMSARYWQDEISELYRSLESAQ